MRFHQLGTKDSMKPCNTTAVAEWTMTTMKTYWADIKAPNEIQLGSTKAGSMHTRVKWEIMTSWRSIAVGSNGSTHVQIRVNPKKRSEVGGMLEVLSMIIKMSNQYYQRR